MADTIRQQKVGNLIKRELSIIFQQEGQSTFRGAMISVTIVRMSPDLGVARAYLSMFTPDEKKDMLEHVRSRTGAIRRALGNKVGKQLRIVPVLEFHVDDSLDYAERIDEILKS